VIEFTPNALGAGVKPRTHRLEGAGVGGDPQENQERHKRKE
jgi:hypothetical protein